MNTDAPPPHSPFLPNHSSVSGTHANDAVSGAGAARKTSHGRWAQVLSQYWQGLVITAFLLAIAGGVGGFWGTRHTAVVMLIRNQGPSLMSGASIEPMESLQEPTAQTLVELARSPEVLQQVILATPWLLSLDHLMAASEIAPVPNTEMVRLTLRSLDAEAAVQTANQYAATAIAAVQRLQSNQAFRLEHRIEEKLQNIGKSLEEASGELANLQRGTGAIDLDQENAAEARQATALAKEAEELRLKCQALDLQITNLQQEIPNHHPELLAARQALDRALLRYTDEHPKVQELRASIATLQERITNQQGQIDPEMALSGGSLAKDLYTRMVELRSQRMMLEKQIADINAVRERLLARNSELPRQRVEYSRWQARYKSLKQTQEILLAQQQVTKLLQQDAGSAFRVFAPASVATLSYWPKMKGALTGAFCTGLLGLFLAALTVLGWERKQTRIRTPEELERITNLPILATLGNLEEMTAPERELWAFRTLTMLQGKLKAQSDQSLVCGFISSRHGEGRSTWVNLLAEAARRQGYRVMTIFTSRTQATSDAAPMNGENRHLPACLPMAAPMELTQTLSGADAQLPSLVIPLPGWSWDLERREQWQEALAKLNIMSKVVVLMELPPASEPEAILLAENVSQIIWLCGKDLADAGETRTQLDMLKHARSQLAGAVFNHASVSPKRNGVMAAAAAMALALPMWAASVTAAEAIPSAVTNAAPPPAVQTVITNSLSVAVPTSLAKWQERLTLGPGDVLTVSIFEQPETLRAGLAIGPDGRLNYLQARDVMASGLTVDELRAKLEQTLLRYYRPPLRVVIQPSAYNSKKYYLMGNVARGGVYSLQRPVTIVEAIATAGGFVTTLDRRNALMQADLGRSFMIRQAETNMFQRVPVDFEALFLQGDLNQNIALAPNDYLYFPPLDMQEVYVLGPGVAAPGVLPYTKDMTVLRAIIARGGFAEKAWRKRVLVVRGSLNSPQKFVVDTGDILAAQATDFKLEPRDIVYVVRRPWAYAEELLESAAMDFLQAVAVTWTGQSVGPWISKPIIKPVDF